MIDQSHPARIKLRDTRLKIWKESMDQSADVRIKYASNLRQHRQLLEVLHRPERGHEAAQNHRNQAGRRKASGSQWIAADPKRQAEYGEALPAIQTAYAGCGSTPSEQRVYGRGGAFGVEFSRITAFAVRFRAAV